MELLTALILANDITLPPPWNEPTGRLLRAATGRIDVPLGRGAWGRRRRAVLGSLGTTAACLPHSHIPHSTPLPSGASLRRMAAHKRFPVGPPQGEKARCRWQVLSPSVIPNITQRPNVSICNITKNPHSPTREVKLARTIALFYVQTTLLIVTFLSNSQSRHIVPRNSAEGHPDISVICESHHQRRKPRVPVFLPLRRVLLHPIFQLRRLSVGEWVLCGN